MFGKSKDVHVYFKEPSKDPHVPVRLHRVRFWNPINDIGLLGFRLFPKTAKRITDSPNTRTATPRFTGWDNYYRVTGRGTEQIVVVSKESRHVKTGRRGLLFRKVRDEVTNQTSKRPVNIIIS